MKKHGAGLESRPLIIKILAIAVMITLTLMALSGTKGLLSSNTASANMAAELNRAKSDYITLNSLLARSEPLVWTFNGSSTTENGGNYSGNTRNYVEVLSSFLATNYDRPNDKMYNIAVGGYTVNNFTFSSAAQYNPDIAYISIGKNDAAYFMSKDGSYYHSGATPPQSMQNPNLLHFKNKVETFIDQARALGALVILGIPNSMSQSFGAQREYYENFFAPVLRDIAVQKDVLYVDYLAAYLADTSSADTYWFKPDRMHVNGLGYLVLASTLIRDLGLDTQESIYTSLDFRTQMAKMHAPYFSPLTAVEDTYIKESDTQKLTSAGCAVYQRSSLLSLMSSNTTIFMGGDTTAGVMTESVIERSFYQYFYRNCAPFNSFRLIGKTEELAQKVAALSSGSVVFYMPEIYDKTGQRVESSAAEFETHLRVTASLLASTRGCRLVLLTPFPQREGQKNTELESYVQVIRALANEKGFALIDFFGYGNALANKNESLIRNWTEDNGLPNCVAHLEIAKYIAKFLNKSVQDITTAGGETTVLTNPSASNGYERDNLTPIFSALEGSTDTKLFNVAEIESIYHNDRIVYSYVQGAETTRVYSKDGYVTIEHAVIGDYIFRAYISRGNKTIFLNDITYQITQIDAQQNAPIYTIRTDFIASDHTNIEFRNNTYGSQWLSLTDTNMVQLGGWRAVELAPVGSDKLIGVKSTFPQGALTQNFNRLTFSMSTEHAGYYRYRVWYYKADGSNVELTPSAGNSIYLTDNATAFYYDITSAKSAYPNIIGFSIQLMGNSHTVLLHSVGIIDLPPLSN